MTAPVIAARRHYTKNHGRRDEPGAIVAFAIVSSLFAFKYFYWHQHLINKKACEKRKKKRGHHKDRCS